jgi:NAD(P)-dependent dehydrogenase (short-subunit alcohol dehydrogenase family)
MSLKGKVAIVTGGNSGIGQAISLALLPFSDMNSSVMRSCPR